MRDASGSSARRAASTSIIHAAALKHVPVCEYNPFEAVQTNVIGTENVVAAAIDATTSRRRCASRTDKAVNPVNLYGATKLCAREDRLAGERLRGRRGGALRDRALRQRRRQPRQRDPAVPRARRETGVLTITDERMTRFWITLDQAVQFVLSAIEHDGRRRGLRPEDPERCASRTSPRRSRPTRSAGSIGIRPGEKLHEVLLTPDEARHTAEFERYYAIYPPFPSWRSAPYPNGVEVPPGTTYSSDTNARWLDAEGIRALIATDALR